MTESELAQRAIALLTIGIPPPREPAEARPVSWLTAWRGVKDLVYGVRLEDPRQTAIIAAIQLCDAAFEHDDWPAFQRATEAVRQAVKGGG